MLLLRLHLKIGVNKNKVNPKPPFKTRYFSGIPRSAHKKSPRATPGGSRRQLGLSLIYVKVSFLTLGTYSPLRVSSPALPSPPLHVPDTPDTLLELPPEDPPGVDIWRLKAVLSGKAYVEFYVPWYSVCMDVVDKQRYRVIAEGPELPNPPGPLPLPEVILGPVACMAV